MQEGIEHLGVRFPPDSNVITPRIEAALRSGRYEAQEVRAIRRFAGADNRVIELGAGIGFVSTFLNRIIGVSEVLCVEANPALCAYIRAVHVENGVAGVEVRNLVAIGDDTDAGFLPFYLRDPFWSSSRDDTQPFQKRIDVPAERLSNLVREVAADTIIADIEGGERDLFQNLDFGSVETIFLELHTRKIGRIGIKHCFDALSGHGFVYDQQISSGGSVLFRRLPKRHRRRS